MQKLSLSQALLQKLSPQQIQFIKLLQIPTVELEARVKEEIEQNPALEEGTDEEMNTDESLDEYSDEGNLDSDREFDIDSYINQDDFSGYKMHGDGAYASDEDDFQIPVATKFTLIDSLYQQLSYLPLADEEYLIGSYMIGSIENDGYLRRSARGIVNDLALTQGIYTTEEQVNYLLTKIQTLEPAGIGARDLKECLLLQLSRKDSSNPYVKIALLIIANYFDEFSKKHFEKIQKKLGINDDDMRQVIQIITRLNPKPGAVEGDDNRAHYLLPDFILHNQNGRLTVTLNTRNTPELRVNRTFAEMIDTYTKGDKNDKNMREAITFVKQKLDAAKWFIDAIQQRQTTLLRTMNAILSLQREFFLEGDESKLRPMILKDVATIIEMDVSTVSRVVSIKTIQTDFGLYPLKFFFSEGIATDSGEDASSREVKNIMKELIESESKAKPLSDDKLEKILHQKGYNIARRTVAKYREQLNIPVARLRRQL